MRSTVAEGKPDLIVLGDSHSVALKLGCDAQGLRSEMLSFSGNIWHAGQVFIHRKQGLWVFGKRQQARVADMRKRLGGLPILSKDVPVVASVGFHMGRLVPPFGIGRVQTDPARFDADEAAQFASSGLVAAYVAHYRAAQLTLLQQIAKRAPVVVVGPPNIFRSSNYAAFYDGIAGLIRGAGLALFDPRDLVGGRDVPFPDALLAADGKHGNADYGAAVIGQMLAQGLIPRRAAE